MPMVCMRRLRDHAARLTNRPTRVGTLCMESMYQQRNHFMAHSSTMNYHHSKLWCLIGLLIQNLILETSAIVSIGSNIAFRIEEGAEDIKRVFAK